MHTAFNDNYYCSLWRKIIICGNKNKIKAFEELMNSTWYLILYCYCFN